MVNPIDVQGFVVRAVDSAQNVNQNLNTAAAAQHVHMAENLRRTENEFRTVNPRSNVEQTNVRSSTEGGSRGTYTPFFGRRRRAKIDLDAVKDEKKGMILDVRL